MNHPDAGGERLELYIQGAIALVIVLGIVVLAVTQELLGRPIAIPELLGWALAGVLGYFFGAGRGRAVTTGVAVATDGMLSAAAKISGTTQQEASPHP